MNRGHIEQVGTPQEIFEQPANPFVMHFLGNVNVFHGRVQRGAVHLGRLAVDYPAYPHDTPSPATAYFRSHDLDLDQEPGRGRLALRGKVVEVNPARPLVKVRVQPEALDVALNVDVGWDRYASMRLTVGDAVWVTPRRFRVFVAGQDYSMWTQGRMRNGEEKQRGVGARAGE